MAAGLGFKDFVTGEVLTAADVDGYLMQGVWVFASAAARDAAVTSPQEGNFAYLKDTNVTTYYTGSAWANLDTTGMTNPMTTTGDIIYSSPGSTPVRLGIGSTGNVLTVAGGLPSWAAPAGGGGANYTLINTGGTALSGSSAVTISSLTGYEKFLVYVNFIQCTTASSTITLRINGDTGTNYIYNGNILKAPASYSAAGIIAIPDAYGDAQTSFFVGKTSTNDGDANTFAAQINGGSTTGTKAISLTSGMDNGAGNSGQSANLNGLYLGSAVISSITLSATSNFKNATTKIYVYGSTN